MSSKDDIVLFIWIYAVETWGYAKPSNINKLQAFTQSPLGKSNTLILRI